MTTYKPAITSHYLTADRSGNVWKHFKASLYLVGDVAEFGVGRGETSMCMARELERIGDPRIVHIFDAFQGLPEPNPEFDTGHPTATGHAFHPKTVVTRTLGNGMVHQFEIHEGWFSEFKDFNIPLCFAHVDCDLYQSTLDALSICEKVVVLGGRIVVDDYCTKDWPGVTRAVDQWRKGKGFEIEGGEGWCTLYRIGENIISYISHHD